MEVMRLFCLQREETDEPGFYKPTQ
jgi:hypothetical protein